MKKKKKKKKKKIEKRCTPDAFFLLFERTMGRWDATKVTNTVKKRGKKRKGRKKERAREKQGRDGEI